MQPALRLITGSVGIIIVILSVFLRPAGYKRSVGVGPVGFSAGLERHAVHHSAPAAEVIDLSVISKKLVVHHPAPVTEIIPVDSVFKPFPGLHRSVIVQIIPVIPVFQPLPPDHRSVVQIVIILSVYQIPARRPVQCLDIVFRIREALFRRENGIVRRRNCRRFPFAGILWRRCICHGSVRFHGRPVRFRTLCRFRSHCRGFFRPLALL